MSDGQRSQNIIYFWLVLGKWKEKQLIDKAVALVKTCQLQEDSILNNTQVPSMILMLLHSCVDFMPEVLGMEVPKDEYMNCLKIFVTNIWKRLGMQNREGPMVKEDHVS